MRFVCIGLCAVAGIVLLTPLACQQGQKSASPGNLPSRLDTGPQAGIDAATYFAHGHLLERQGALERAVEQYEHALELKPDFPAALNRHGIVLNKLGRHTQASAQFRAAIELQPDEAFLYNNLGFSLHLGGEYQEAEQILARALEIQPSFARARMNHAIVLAQLDRYPEAFEEFRKVGSEADAHYNIAVIQTEARRYVDATESLDRALKLNQLNPQMEAARQQMRVIARLAAQQESAHSPAAPQNTAGAAPPPAGDPPRLAEPAEPAGTASLTTWELPPEHTSAPAYVPPPLTPAEPPESVLAEQGDSATKVNTPTPAPVDKATPTRTKDVEQKEPVANPSSSEFLQLRDEIYRRVEAGRERAARERAEQTAADIAQAAWSAPADGQGDPRRTLVDVALASNREWRELWREVAASRRH